MGLHRDDKEFRYPGISYLDYKQSDIDRVLTGFLPRLWWRGSPSVLIGSRPDLKIAEFVESFLEHTERFENFDADITYRWVETHLLDPGQPWSPHSGGSRRCGHCTGSHIASGLRGARALMGPMSSCTG